MRWEINLRLLKMILLDPISGVKVANKQEGNQSTQGTDEH